MIRLLTGLVVAVGLAAGSAEAESWSRLVDPDDLAVLTAAGSVTVLDIREPKDYAAGHVDGSLSAPYGTWRGPKDNPGLELSDATLTERLQSLGIEPGERVIVTYQGKDTTDFGAAARVYWTLKSAGLTEIAILNGGILAWIDAGLPLSTEPAAAERSSAIFVLADTWLIDRAGIEALVQGNRQAIAIDARPAAFHAGQKKHPAANRPGTLPGARSLPESGWFPNGKPAMGNTGSILERVKSTGYPADGQDELISFCNTGHWAATNWFALSELAGIENVKLYPESMVGWANSGGVLVNGPAQ